jgi:uncharacterized membrane protein YfcA
MEFLILTAIGLAMGLFGGLLGIGGSVIMVPALVFAFGENQHLYQASAMICNCVVGASAAFIHRREKVIVMDVVKWLVPSAIAGVLAGVWLSNAALFAGENSRKLAFLFGLFLVGVTIQQFIKFLKPKSKKDDFDISGVRKSVFWTSITGIATGLYGGLLGMGGGIVATPMQQHLLKMPLKRAISNTSALTAAMAFVGAIYKNLTLPEHGISPLVSIRMAAIVAVTAMCGSMLGAKLMYKLPRRLVRGVLIAILILAAYRMLTV